MAGFYPIPSTRSTELLAHTRLIQQFHADALATQRLQNQISTGRRITRPGEEPGAAQRAQTLQRLLELKAQTATNLQTAQSYLNATDTALAHVASLLTDVRAEALAANSDTATAANRQAAAQQVKETITQLLEAANKQFRGRYLFAGSRLGVVPFRREGGAIAYQGNSGALGSFVDVDLVYATNAAGAEVFGAYSTQVHGTIDLNPALTADTPLAALDGGRGLVLGSIEISDGFTRQVIDLSTAATIGDVAALLEAHPPEGRTITATITPAGLTIGIDAAGGGSLTIKEVAGGNTAQSLQIYSPVGTGVTPVVGGDLNPVLRLTTRLADLQTAAPLDLASGLRIRNGNTTYVIDTSTVQTVEDLLSAINQSPAHVLAEVAQSGDRLLVRSRLSGADFAIGENGGTTATQLGIRSLNIDTPLAELNSGRGVAAIAGTDFTIHRKDGFDLAVDVSSAVTIGDVINLINSDPNNQNPATRVVARLAATGNGIELFDGNTAGADSLGVTASFGSRAAIDLGLIPAGATAAAGASGPGGDTLTGSDPNPLEVAGIFNSLLRLQEALENFDHLKVARAVELLDQDFERLTLARGEIGARNQALDTIRTQLEDETVELQSNLSDTIDTNLPQAISELTARQASLQASLQLAARVFQSSLLDYL